MSKYYVFFDVDGTILKGTSMIDFLKFYFNEKYSRYRCLGLLRYKLYKLQALFVKHILFSRTILNRLYYRCYAHQSCEDLTLLAKTWFDRFIKNNAHAYRQEIIDELKLHQQNGADIVFVSGSFEACLLPLAAHLGVKHILSTQMKISDGCYTGRIDYPMIGKAKTRAIKKFLNEQKVIDLKDCYAYGDHRSDKHMLDIVGHPRVVPGDKLLESWAIKRNIPILT